YLTYMNSINSGLAVQELLKITQEQLPQKTKTVLEASDFDNQPENNGQDLASQLYGQNLNSSVSQLETFYENSYEYFLNYGLKLRRRFENEFDIIQAGNYFLESFDCLVKKLNKQHRDLAYLSSIELEQMLNSVRNVMKDEGKYSQLMNDHFNQYLLMCIYITTYKIYNYLRFVLNETLLRAQC